MVSIDPGGRPSRRAISFFLCLAAFFESALGLSWSRANFMTRAEPAREAARRKSWSVVFWVFAGWWWCGGGGEGGAGAAPLGGREREG